MKINLLPVKVLAFLLTLTLFAACKPHDINPPVITLLGDNPQVIVYKSAEDYVDPGYTALDAIDGPVTVSVSGVINLKSAGAQTINYEATDGSGNTGRATRTVIVDAAQYVAGIYAVSDVNTEGSPPAYTDTITASDTAYNVIFFKHFGAMNQGFVKATFSGNTMTIPQQTVHCGNPLNDYVFTGFGDFTDSSMLIDYTRVLNNIPVSGTGTYIKQ